MQDESSRGVWVTRCIQSSDLAHEAPLYDIKLNRPDDVGLMKRSTSSSRSSGGEGQSHRYSLHRDTVSLMESVASD